MEKGKGKVGGGEYSSPGDRWRKEGRRKKQWLLRTHDFGTGTESRRKRLETSLLPATIKSLLLPGGGGGGLSGKTFRGISVAIFIPTCIGENSAKTREIGNRLHISLCSGYERGRKKFSLARNSIVPPRKKKHFLFATILPRNSFGVLFHYM